MKTLPPSIFQFLGILTNGDMGGLTFYKSHRGRLVFFPKTWPKDPATYHQKLNRDKFRHAAIRWNSLAPRTRIAWTTLAKRANLTITGYNLYIAYITGKAAGTVATCERLTGIDVRTPTGPPLPNLTL